MEKYEAPEVMTFGELEFEPTAVVHCTTLVTCSGHTGNCSTTVTLDP